MSHQYADCSLCGGAVEPQVVELDYRYKGELYIMRDVPAGVCQQCGEKYLTAKIAKEIEKLITSEQVWPETVSVPMMLFPGKTYSESIVAA